MTPAFRCLPNPDLFVDESLKPGWNRPKTRRAGFHDLHEKVRYGVSIRSPEVWQLRHDHSPALAARADVQALTGQPFFSAMVVLRDDRLLLERYAPDFGPERLHAIMSITKTMTNLILGPLVTAGKVDLSATVDRYLPWIGPGYAKARVQDVLDMNVANDFSEDYTDPDTGVYRYETSLGFRLPAPGTREGTIREFVAAVGLEKGAADCRNRKGHAQYKSTNTDVIALIAEAVTGKPLIASLTEIVEAAGIERPLFMATDRDWAMMFNGGVSMTARDLARYGMLFARGGQGVNGRTVGCPAFIEASRKGGVPMAPPRDWLRYSNQTNTDGDWIGHGGYGGQYMLINPTTRTVCTFFSVLENADGYASDYFPPVIRMLEEISRC